MTVTIIRLSAHPARTSTQHGYTSTEVAYSISTPAPGRSVRATSLQDIGRAVARFGHDLRAENPDASFIISIAVSKGQRKPRGFDAAEKAGDFGHKVFLRSDVGADALHRPLTPPTATAG